MKRLHQILSGFILVIFSLYLVPHELVHVFYNHHDTEHTANTDGNTHLSTIHIHCDFLSTDLIDFLPGHQPDRATCDAQVKFAYSHPPVPVVVSCNVCSESRGPPALV